MKNLMKLAFAVFTFAFFSSNLFAQEAQSVKQVKSQKTNWVDADGDGVCDNFGTPNQGSKMQGKKMNRRGNKGLNSATGSKNGFGDGTGVRPQDGTGFGRKSGNGTGTCDGTGSRKGNGRKGSGQKGSK